MPLKKAQTSVLQSQQQGSQPCELTWYDPALGGINTTGRANPYAKTASGEAYDPNADTCAAPPQYPFGTFVTFSYGGNTVTCKVNDRGGAITGSHFDLSRHAANTLGIINSGRVSATFTVSGTAGQSGKAAQAKQDASQPSGGGGFQLSLGSLFTLAAGDVAQFVFDAFIKFPVVLVGDYIIIPAWHWNQRAVTYFQQEILFKDKTGKVTVGVAAFWGFGYVLLWGDPDARGLDMLKKRTNPRRSHLARHVQRLQSLQARRKLIKPRDVKQETAVKPTPKISTVSVTQVGTMTTTRPERVKVSGFRANRTNGTNETGSGEGSSAKKARPFRARTPNPNTSAESNAEHRTRFSASQSGRRNPHRSS